MSRKSKAPRGKALSEVRFVVFDSETTGLDLSKNRLLSMAGVGMIGHEIQLDDAFEAMVAQSDVGGSDAAVVHGLISHDLAGGLPKTKPRLGSWRLPAMQCSLRIMPRSTCECCERPSRRTEEPRSGARRSTPHSLRSVSRTADDLQPGAGRRPT